MVKRKIPKRPKPKLPVPKPCKCLRGTWKPKLTFGGNAAGLTYASQTGVYTKICGVVICNFNIVLSSKGNSTGMAELAGLPFASILDEASYGAGSLSFWGNMGTPLVAMSVGLYSNATIAGFRGATAATGTLGGLTEAAFSDATQVAGTIVYHAA